MLFNGEFEVSAYIGSEEILEAWFGESKVYPNAFLEVSVSSLSFVAAGESKTFHIESTDGLEWTITGLPSGWSASALSGNIPGDVTITAPNNTTNSSIKGTLTITLEGITATVSLTQSAGTMTTEYSDWVTNALAGTVSGTIPAAGGTATLSASADQSRVKTTKWNGIVTNTETENQTIDVSDSATYSKISGAGSVSGRTVTFPNNTTSQTTTGVYRASYDGKMANTTVTQSAGTMTTEYSDWVTVKIYASYSPWGAVASAGGTVSLTFTEEQNQTVTTKWNGIVTNTETNEREIGGVITQAMCSKVSGSGTLTGSSVTFANNTSTDELSGTYRVTYNGLTSDVTITQNAGSKVYGAWQNVSWAIDTTSFTAAGGRSDAVMNIARTWTWNGVAGSGGTETSTSSLRNATSSPVGIGISSENWIQAPSLGTTFKAQTTYTLSSASAAASNQVSATVVQAANYVTAARALKTRNLTYPQIGAGGGTSNVQWDAYPTDADIDKLWGFTWASGANGTWSQAKRGGSNAQTGMSYKWAGPSGNFTALNTSTGAVTASSKGTTVSGVTSSPTITATQTCKFTNNAAYGGSSVSWDTTATGTCSQEANDADVNEIIISKIQYDNTWLSTELWDAIPASGPRYLGVKTQNHQKYTSGSEFTRNITINPYTDFIITGGFAGVHNELGIVVGSRGTTVGDARTGTVRVLYSGVYSNILSFTQVANEVTKTTQSGGVYTYGNVTAGAIKNATIPASGGSATATAGNGSQSWNRTAIIATDTYTSGSTAQRTIQGATSGTNTVAPSRTSLSGNAGSKGQVTSGQTTVQSATVTWSANGKSASGTMYVYQQENKLIQMSSNCSGYTRYGVREYTSGSYEYSEQNSYYCGYRETVKLNVSIMQSGIMRNPVFKSLQAWSCRTGNVQGQGSSTVTFSNPKFGINIATLELSESEKNYDYVLFQLQMTYTDSGGAGAIPNYVWSGAVTYSGSLAIYTKANATNANVTVSAPTRSAAADAAVASDVDLENA